MSPARKSAILRYGAAVGFTIVALAGRLVLEPLLNEYHRFLTFYVAVVAAAWYGGLGPSLVATLLSCLAADFFVLPDTAADMPWLHHQVELGGFLFVSLSFAAFGKAVRSAQRRAEAKARELAEANCRKDEFLAMLAHELRNPLAPLANAAQLLQLIGPGEPAFEEARQIVERQVRHMARLVDDLLDVSRISRGKIELRRTCVDVAEVIEMAIETSRPLIAARKHELIESFPHEPVFLMADPLRLAQVLANLLNNAAKYTPDQGHIWLTATREGEEVSLHVRDDGIGVAAEMLPHVFGLFVQGDRALARSQGGLGIGLTLVKQLVELHGGRVDAFSKGPGRGSEFVVKLPVVAAAIPAAGDHRLAGNGRASAGRRVLVVDDLVDAAESLATLLRRKGNEVRVAHDGPAALLAAEAFEPEVILLDIGLPGMDGYEVARRLRGRPGDLKPMLVALSGYGENDRCRSREAGFDAYLVKPADLVALNDLITRPLPQLVKSTISL